MKPLIILAALLLPLLMACAGVDGGTESREGGSAAADSSRGGGVSAEKMLAEFREDELKALGAYGDKRVQVTVAETPDCSTDIRQCELPPVEGVYVLLFGFASWEAQLKFREERTASCLVSRYGDSAFRGEVVLAFTDCREAKGIVAPPLAQDPKPDLAPAPGVVTQAPTLAPTPGPTATRTPRPTATPFPTPTPPTPPEDNTPPPVLAGFRCSSYSIWNRYRLELYAQETWQTDFLMDGSCAAITLRDYWTVEAGVYRMLVPTGYPKDMILDAALSQEALSSDSGQELFNRAQRREDLFLHCEGSADTRRGYLSLVNCRELE